MEQFIELVNDYIKWYNENRIKLSLSGLSPVEGGGTVRRDRCFLCKQSAQERVTNTNAVSMVFERFQFLALNRAGA